MIKVSNEKLIKEVVKLAQIVWKEHFSGIISDSQIDFMLDKFQSYNAITKQIQAENYQYYLLNDENNKNVGYFAIVPKESETFLSKAYVLEECRGKGYFKKALEFIKQYKKPVTLTVNRNNKSAIEIYKKAGFKIIDEVDNCIGNGYFMNDYIMKLEV